MPISISRSLVNSLNDSVREVGEEKVKMLDEIKVFRRKINMFKWKVTRLEIEEEYIAAMKTEYQTRRVTKQDQANLQALTQDSDNRKEYRKLEANIKHLKRTMNEKIEVKQAKFHGLQKKLNKYKRSTIKLEKEVSSLESTGKELQDMAKVRRNRGFAKKGGRINDVMTRRKILDQINDQQNQIQLLEKERQTLHLRTFPSFGDTKHN